MLNSECREDWGLLAEVMVLEAPLMTQSMSYLPGDETRLSSREQRRHGEASEPIIIIISFKSLAGVEFSSEEFSGPAPHCDPYPDKSHHPLTDVFIHSLSCRAAQHKGSSLPPLPLIAAPTQTQDSHYQSGPAASFGDSTGCPASWSQGPLPLQQDTVAGSTWPIHLHSEATVSPPHGAGHVSDTNAPLGKRQQGLYSLVDQPLHEGWFSGLMLLDSCGAHLLGQRTLQMALGLEASGGSEDNKEKQNSTVWATLIWCF